MKKFTLKKLYQNILMGTGIVTAISGAISSIVKIFDGMKLKNTPPIKILSHAQPSPPPPHATIMEEPIKFMAQPHSRFHNFLEGSWSYIQSNWGWMALSLGIIIIITILTYRVKNKEEIKNL